MHAMSRRRPRRPGMRAASLALVAQAVTALAVAIFIATGTGVHLPFGSSGYKVVALLPNAAGLDEHDHPRVTVGGVKAGRLESVRYDTHRRLAVATFTLDDDVRGKLFADASVRLQPRSALNDLVVDIDPGSPAAGALRGKVIRRAVPAPVAYDRILGVFDSDTRAYTQILIGTLRDVLRDRPGALRAALDRLPDTEQAATDVARQLADRRRQLARFVDDLARIAQATGRRGDELTHVIASARRTLDVTAARQRELQATLAELPSTLDQARTTFASVSRLSKPLVPALVRLRPAARALPGALGDVDRLIPQLRATTRDLGDLATRGQAPLRDSRLAVTRLGAASPQLQPALGTLEKLVRAITDNKEASRALLEFWPGAISSNNTLSPVTRSKFFDVLPVAPGAVGLPGGSPSAVAALRSAASALQRQQPQLFRDVPAGEALPLRVLRALTTAYCLRRSAGACLVNSLIAKQPLRMLGG